MKLSPSGEKLLEIGERMVPGHDRTHFCKPTGVRSVQEMSVEREKITQSASRHTCAAHRWR